MAEILVVDDEEQLAESIKDWLGMHGHTVSVALDGSTALNFLIEESFDVVILDVMLPDMSGFRVCREYRRAGGSARVLMLTACGAPDQKETGLDAGADDYMSKPFSINELGARVRALMRRSLSLMDQVIKFKDLEIDPRMHTVSRANCKIKLQPQEYALLEYMAREPNRIFTNEEIIRKVWDGKASVDTVRTHIKTLRKKIDQEPLAPLIKTIHGVGYTLSYLD